METFISFFLVALLGPGLISPDLANNAMPLYLSRPFSRAEYVIGKLSVLLAVTSAGHVGSWFAAVRVSDNSRGVFLVLGQLAASRGNCSSDRGIWILTISLIALALSAWVKWKPVAAAALFGIFFVAAGFGTVSNVMLQTRWGTLLNLASAMSMIWRWLFLKESQYRITTPPWGTMPAWTGLITLISVCGDRSVPAGLEDSAGAGGAVMQPEDRLIVFENVSKFYGEVLGVNRVSLVDRAGRHESGGSERRGKDDADEPDDGSAPSHKGDCSSARHFAVGSGDVLTETSDTARSSTPFQKACQGIR